MIRLVELLPDNLRAELGENPSVLCLRAAEQKYLIFSDNSESPAFVLQPGTKSELTSLKEYTSQLYATMPCRIPEPLAILLDQNNKHYLVQRGISGVPWFTLRELVGKAISWDDIVKHSKDALEVFHQATSSNSSWIRTVSLTDQFIDLYQQSHVSERSAPYDYEAVLAYCIRILSEHSPAECFLQHGDMSVNNFLFRDDNVGIIDFEQFGRVYLPLHDEFLLVDSLLQLKKSPTSEFVTRLWSEILASSRYNYPAGSSAINVLFMMHVMWWLIETEGQARRSLRREAYFSALNNGFAQITKSQPDFFENTLSIISK